MQKRAREAEKLVFAGILAILLYVFLHESGHALVALAYGGRITEFSLLPWDAHVSVEGMPLSAIFDLGGPLLPVFAAIPMALMSRKGEHRSFLQMIKAMFVLMCMMSLLAGVILPLAFLMGFPELGDDVIKAMLQIGCSPLLITGISLGIMVLLGVLFVRRGLIDGFRERLGRRAYPVAAGLLILIVAATLWQTSAKDGTQMRGVFRISGGEAQGMPKEQVDIEIPEDGEYVLHIRWTPSREGVLTAVALNSEDRCVFACTGEKASVESFPQEMEAGTYQLSIYGLTTEADWLEYARLNGEAAEIDYAFASGEAFSVSGAYLIERQK